MNQDNRNYLYNDENMTTARPEYECIEQWIEKGSKVIDLGCGNCSLLSVLKEKKNVRELGVEISESGVDSCWKKGIKARIGRIDVALTDIGDNAFDYAVCNVTIQMVMYPEVLLNEMKRIARYQIISFPNFAYVLNRLELLFRGRMPRRLLGGFNWYDTGHIHQLSINDFRELTGQAGLEIKDRSYHGGFRGLNFLAPNLLAAGAIYLMEKHV